MRRIDYAIVTLLVAIISSIGDFASGDWIHAVDNVVFWFAAVIVILAMGAQK